VIAKTHKIIIICDLKIKTYVKSINLHMNDLLMSVQLRLNKEMMKKTIDEIRVRIQQKSQR
jgi:hypothetical protein